MGNITTTLFRWFWGTVDTKIIMVGLDAVGKTSILYRLKLGTSIVLSTVPTIGFNVESIKCHGISFTVWDIGGGDKIRKLWRHYSEPRPQPVVFVLDSVDHERIDEAIHELGRMSSEEEFSDSIFLIFANKQDNPFAMDVAEIKEILIKLPALQHRSWHLQPCSAISGDGLYEGFDWLATQLKLTK